jgi:hypothetical protein
MILLLQQSGIVRISYSSFHNSCQISILFYPHVQPQSWRATTCRHSAKLLHTFIAVYIWRPCASSRTEDAPYRGNSRHTLSSQCPKFTFICFHWRLYVLFHIIRICFHYAYFPFSRVSDIGCS